MSSPINAVVAMDWGGTWIRVAVVDRGGSVIWEDRVPSPKGRDAVPIAGRCRRHAGTRL